jgi:hypothetical protein
MKYAVEMDSGAIIYISIKIGSAIRKLIGEQRHRQNGGLLLFFLNKKSRLTK